MASREETLRELVETLEKIQQRKQFFHLEDFHPYPKQQEFFDSGEFPERMFGAGNQRGKSEAGAYEMACHLTGLYPDDWYGRKFERPIVAWAAGKTGIVTRDVQQSKLFGMPGVPESLGTGMVPKEKIIGQPSTQRGVTDFFDTVHIRHVSGGISSLTFKSFEQGWEKFLGKPVDVIWLDEEPDELTYNQCMARTFATKGMIYVTLTPENGYTNLVNRFYKNDQPKFRKLIRMRKTDAPVIEGENLERIMAGVPKWQWDMRLDGEPLQGQGLVFSMPRDKITEKAMPFVAIPPHWKKLWGIDFGVSEEHNFAAVLGAWDVDNDVIHIIDAFKMWQGGPMQHAVRMKQSGILVPVVWPHDGEAVWQSRGYTESTAAIYKKQGLKMCSSHATFEGGGYSTEAGILEMELRFTTKRLLVAEHLTDWLDEYMQYSRKDGNIVKKNDDLMSATRILVMAKREAKPVVLGGQKPDPRMNGWNGIAQNAELSGDDLF